TITRLPNLIATRETTHFEDTPSMQIPVAGVPMMPGRMSRSVGTIGPSMSGTEYKSLHSTGTSSTPVTYRDGTEVQGTDTQRSRDQSEPPKVLTTEGEFGPILSVVMGDVLRSETATWQRWEKGGSEPVAVFHYEVPEEQSNYLAAIPLGGKVEQIYPGYHGEIAIDPATGAILRISAVL